MDKVKICNALGNEIRFQIVKSLNGPAIKTCCDRIGPDEHGVCVDDVVMATGLAQSTVSQHLQVLADSGLIRKEKRGKWTCFFLDQPLIENFIGDLSCELRLEFQPGPAAEKPVADAKVRAVTISDFDIEMD